MTTKVFIVQAEHWIVPGRPMSAHATRESAAAEALSKVNLMLSELKVRPATDHEAGLARVKDILKCSSRHGPDADADADVWIEELELEGL